MGVLVGLRGRFRKVEALAECSTLVRADLGQLEPLDSDAARRRWRRAVEAIQLVGVWCQSVGKVAAFDGTRGLRVIHKRAPVGPFLLQPLLFTLILTPERRVLHPLHAVNTSSIRQVPISVPGACRLPRLIQHLLYESDIRSIRTDVFPEVLLPAAILPVRRQSEVSDIFYLVQELHGQKLPNLSDLFARKDLRACWHLTDTQV
mmetsp:Transcript_58647/g.168418  ORF Transcript_58647/g.168418 Transcript_58647/m.168418 type:complete len:204 (-) Transcript_58647:431-1042(-)